MDMMLVLWALSAALLAGILMLVVVMIARGMVEPAEEKAIERAVAPDADLERAVIDQPLKRRKPK
jgi:hypothetical protein